MAGIEPVRACRAGHVGSRRTAKPLGFRMTREVPYYALVTG